MAKPTLSPTGIRTDVVSRLKGKTSAGVKVFDSRRINYEPTEFPAITVTTLGGTDDRWGFGTLLAKHTERVAIVGDVKGTAETTIADALDTLEGQILDALAGDPEWVGAFEAVDKVDTAKQINGKTGDLIGHVAIVLDLKYSVQYVQNPALIPDLERVAVDTHAASPAGAAVSDRLILGEPLEA